MGAPSSPSASRSRRALPMAMANLPFATPSAMNRRSSTKVTSSSGERKPSIQSVPIPGWTNAV